MKIIIYLALVARLIGAATGWCQDVKFPKYAGWVNDFAGIISDEYKVRASVLIGELEQKTTAEIAIVTVKDIGAVPIEDYAVGLFEKWGIGKKGKDNGLLILVALQQSRMRIEVGYGLEGIITDSISGSIIRQKMVPAFSEGKFGAGIFNATAAAASLIAKDAGVELTSLEGIPAENYQVSRGVAVSRIVTNLIFLAIIFGFFGLRIFIFPLLLGGYWRSGRGGFGGMGGFGGGFGGFGGGMSGGGGASGSW